MGWGWVQLGFSDTMFSHPIAESQIQNLGMAYGSEFPGWCVKTQQQPFCSPQNSWVKMDVHPIKNGIFIGIDPYPYGFDMIVRYGCDRRYALNFGL